MNILEMPMGIPLFYVVVIGGLILLIVHWIWRYIVRVNEYFPESKLFMNCRQKGLVMMQKWYTNGFFIFDRLEKSKKGDMYTKLPENSNEGIRFDPRLQSKASKCYTLGGLEIYQYGSNTPYNLSAINAVAMSQVLNHVRDKYPELNFLPNEVIIEYSEKSKNVMIQDCVNLVTQFNTSNDLNISTDKANAIMESIKEDMVSSMGTVDENKINYEVEREFMSQLQKLKAEKLAEVFTKIQSELIEKVVETRYFSFAEAFGNLINCITAVDMQAYKGMIDMLSDLKRSQFNAKLLITIGIAVMFMAIGAGIFYTLAGSNGGA